MNSLFKRVGWIFVSLTLILGFGTMSSAVAYEAPTGDPRAIPMSEAEFVAGAVEFAGLTASEAHAAYADPETIATVPVQVRTHVGHIAIPSSNSASSAEAKATGGVDCEVTALQKFENVFGHDLAYFEMTKWFQTEDLRVVNFSSHWSGWTSDLGAVGGWRYMGEISRNSGFNGPDQTSYFTQAVGGFEDLLGAYWTPEITITVHGEGSYEIFLPNSDQEYYLSHCNA